MNVNKINKIPVIRKDCSYGLFSHLLTIVLVLYFNVSYCQRKEDKTIDSIDSLCFKTEKMQQQFCTLLNQSTLKPDSKTIFLSLYKTRSVRYVNIFFCKKNSISSALYEYEFRPQPLKGYIRVFEYNVYVFGDNTVSSYFKKTGVRQQIPIGLENVTFLHKIKYEDELPMNDNVSNDCPIYITYDIMRYAVKNNELRSVDFGESKHALNLSIYRTTHRLYRRPDTDLINEKKYLKNQKKLTKEIIHYFKKSIKQ